MAIHQNTYLTLVNQQHRSPQNWNSHFNFSVGKNTLNELCIIESKTLKAYQKLRAYLLKNEGVQIELDSVYRSFKEQQDIWDAWLIDPKKGPDYCKKYVAPVGYSEHHTGLAIDIFLVKKREIIRDEDTMAAKYSKDFAKIHQHLAKFGFILRYPEGKEAITGYAYEPWHFRYIDSPKIANYITKNHLTLEEYLKQSD